MNAADQVFSAPAAAVLPVTAPNVARGAPRAVGIWLCACCVLVFAMVVVGGVTRLTHSGLSITEWQPIVGTLPPLYEADWARAFAKYQATPQYRDVNRGMTLSSFKPIFWWEYAHRLLGRVVGVAFLVPLAVFVARRQVSRRLLPRLVGIFALGGLQGLVGWYMVKSGLVDDPQVSPLRLSLHLGLALAIFAAMAWTALSLLRDATPRPGRSLAATAWLRRLAGAFAALVGLQALSGALVAGLRAGFAYNTFPRMNGHWVPPEILLLEPWTRNFTSNMATVQFVHRVLGALVAAVALALWLAVVRSTPSSVARRAAHAMLVAAVAQVALGIATLLSVVALPLAALHQACAVLLLGTALNLAHVLRAPASVR